MRLAFGVDSEMDELQWRGVGRGPDGGVRQRRRPLPVQRAGGHRVHSRRPGARVLAGEDVDCEYQ